MANDDDYDADEYWRSTREVSGPICGFRILSIAAFKFGNPLRESWCQPQYSHLIVQLDGKVVVNTESLSNQTLLLHIINHVTVWFNLLSPTHKSNLSRVSWDIHETCRRGFGNRIVGTSWTCWSDWVGFYIISFRTIIHPASFTLNRFLDIIGSQ